MIVTKVTPDFIPIQTLPIISEKLLYISQHSNRLNMPQMHKLSLSIFPLFSLSNSVLPSPHGRRLRNLRFPFFNLPAASFPTRLYPRGSQETAQISFSGDVSHLASSSPVGQQVVIFVPSALPTPGCRNSFPVEMQTFEFLPDFNG